VRANETTNSKAQLFQDDVDDFQRQPEGVCLRERPPPLGNERPGGADGKSKTL
jgi:hypothetical protein